MDRNMKCSVLLLNVCLTAVAANAAIPTGELLNSSFDGEFTAGEYLSREVRKCRSCHTKGSELANTKASLDCTSCHFSLAAEHPPVGNKHPNFGSI